MLYYKAVNQMNAPRRRRSAALLDNNETAPAAKFRSQTSKVACVDKSLRSTLVTWNGILPREAWAIWTECRWLSWAIKLEMVGPPQAGVKIAG